MSLDEMYESKIPELQEATEKLQTNWDLTVPENWSYFREKLLDLIEVVELRFGNTFSGEAFIGEWPKTLPDTKILYRAFSGFLSNTAHTLFKLNEPSKYEWINNFCNAFLNAVKKSLTKLGSEAPALKNSSITKTGKSKTLDPAFNSTELDPICLAIMASTASWVWGRRTIVDKAYRYITDLSDEDLKDLQEDLEKFKITETCIEYSIALYCGLGLKYEIKKPWMRYEISDMNHAQKVIGLGLERLKKLTNLEISRRKLPSVLPRIVDELDNISKIDKKKLKKSLLEKCDEIIEEARKLNKQGSALLYDAVNKYILDNYTPKAEPILNNKSLSAREAIIANLKKAKLDKYIDPVKGAIQKEFTVWRYVNRSYLSISEKPPFDRKDQIEEYIKFFKSKVKPGQILKHSDVSYCSTTLVKRQKNCVRFGDIEMEITLKPGTTYGQELNKVVPEGQAEFLLPKGQKFVVTEIKENKNDERFPITLCVETVK